MKFLVGLPPQPQPYNFVNKKAAANQIKRRSACGFSLAPENFFEQEQSGILAQNFFSLREIFRKIFPDFSIQNANEKFCQVAIL